jgi:hypothetical protein
MNSSPIQKDILMASPYFLITIDTEGDNLWSYSTTVKTENAGFISRFQALSEKYGFKPTYLANYEMANSEMFQKFGKKLLQEKKGEIGMHLHAWNCPPSFSLTVNDDLHKPFLIEYPIEAMKEKISFMTKHLETIFEVKITSHRAGRWAFNETYARMLNEEGYLVDSSVTPHFSWKNDMGDPNGSGGCCYLNFPEEPYQLSLENIKRQSEQNILLEVPVTVTYLNKFWVSGLRSLFKEGSLPARALNRTFAYPVWLRPNGFNLENMLAILRKVVIKKWTCAVFMLRSSELMPGGSPYFPDPNSVEKLYNDLEILFKTASEYFRPATLTEFFYSRLNQ